MCCTHIFGVVEGIEDIIGQARQQINYEPTPQVIHSNYLGI